MTTPDNTQPQYGAPWIGIAWMLTTGFLFVGVTGIVRYVGSNIPAPEAAFIRYIFGLGIMLPLMWPALRRGFSAKSLAIFGLRGFTHALGVALWFYAMANIPIAEVTAIGYTSPIYITLGAALFFGERLALRRIMAVVVAFGGAMIILRPGLQEISSGQIAQLVSAPLFAVSYLIAKKLAMEQSPTLVVGMLSIFVTIGLAPLAWSVWITPALSDIMWLGLVAVFATAGHFTMTKALKAAPLMVIQPVTFLQLVWATLLGAIVFGEAADIYVLTGGGVIIASVSFISYREWRLSRRARTPPAEATR
ncbi:MAG: DMT family transporter [Alphaproteobacteria bacterium]|nr:DMT family transporter [Alphaproteobacteria bacterium]